MPGAMNRQPVSLGSGVAEGIKGREVEVGGRYGVGVAGCGDEDKGMGVVCAKEQAANVAMEQKVVRNFRIGIIGSLLRKRPCCRPE
jgi:hypothetical protein